MSEERGGNLLQAKEGRHKKKRGKGSPFLRGAAVLLLAVLLGAVGSYGYLVSTTGDRIAKGVTVSSLDLGGKTAEEAKRLLRERAEAITLTFVAPVGQAVIVPAKDRAPNGVAPVAAFKVDDAVAAAYGVGREHGRLAPVAALLRAAVLGKDVPLAVSLDRSALRRALAERYAGKVQLARDATFIVTLDAEGTPKVEIVPEKEGWQIDLDKVAANAEDRMQGLEDGTIQVPMARSDASVTAADLEPLEAGVHPALARAPLTLTVREDSWTVGKETLAAWLTAVPGENGAKVRLGLDADSVKKFLQARAESLSTEPKDAQFEEKDGKVTTFVPSVDGETLDLDGSYALIEKAVFGDDVPADGTVALPMAVVPPKVPTEASNPYGIKEIIGAGSTNFRGSPKNRVHNIGVGAASVNGTLVAPGEEFSMLKTLGTIDQTTGYLQELVIKENKTTPEYGGGLCQIGSTAFRAALDVGLPITERQNHSYRVPYYERDGDGNDIGPGKDATIYDPAPDFKFMNDTGHTILILTAIKKNKLTFTFWGVRDGRKSAQTASRVYNIVPPPEKKTIPTTDLPPGTEKCTEHAHPGSEAVFDYTVTYADGTVKTKEFHSHYKPWQEVCLEGTDPALMPPPDGAAATPASPDDASADAAGAHGN